MDLNGILRRVTKIAADNSPVILTAIGVAGTLATAYLSGKATIKAFIEIQEEQLSMDLHGEDRSLTSKEKASLVWKYYIPPVATGAVTISCIIMANRIGTRRTAALAAAYVVSERAFEEYKTKVVERIGRGKEEKIRDEIAQDRVSNAPVESRQVIIAGTGEILCLEGHTGRYFQSDMESLRKAANDLNGMIIQDMYASLTDFYNLIGLPRTSGSDELGWNVDSQLELAFSATIATDGRPCMVMSYKTAPIPNFNRFH